MTFKGWILVINEGGEERIHIISTTRTVLCHRSVRVSFIYLVEFHGSARNKKAPVEAQAKIGEFMSKLNSTPRVADHMRMWVDKGLPSFTDVQVRLEFVPESLEWSGVIEIADWHNRLSKVKGLEEYLTHLVRASVNRVIQQIFEKRGFKNFTYRTVSAVVNAEERPYSVDDEELAVAEENELVNIADRLPKWAVPVILALLSSILVLLLVAMFGRFGSG